MKHTQTHTYTEREREREERERDLGTPQRTNASRDKSRRMNPTETGTLPPSRIPDPCQPGPDTSHTQHGNDTHHT